MITVRNDGHDPIAVCNHLHADLVEVLKPREEMSFIGNRFTIEYAKVPKSQQRFDPRGGDPYNRVGSRAVP